MNISLSTANLVMTNYGWMSPYDISKDKDNIEILFLKNGEWRFTKVKNIELKRKGHPFIGKGHGHPELYLVKADNILYTVEYERVWNKEERKSVRSFLKPKFLKAKEIDGKFWASPLNIATRDKDVLSPIGENPDEFWFIGYYLGLGTKEKGLNMSFKLKTSKADEFESVLKKLDIRFKREDLKSFYEYYIGDRKWNEFLNRVFPKNEWKSITPYWLLTVNKECKKAFFDGIIEASGTKNQKNQKITIKDKALILTLKLIAQDIGYSVGIYTGKGSIDNPSWQLVAEESARSSTVIDNYRFGLVREVKENKDKTMSIWELEIEEGSGILIDGIVVK